MKAAKKLMDMETEDIRILAAVELGMKKHEMVPIKHISYFARYELEETEYRLDRVHKMGLLQRNKVGSVAYCLISEGYDILALHTLFSQGHIKSIGPSLGRGKESDVYRCLTKENEQVALKLHRLGQTSFRNVRKFRSYIEERSHISWLYVSRLSAKREFEGLKRVAKLNLRTPIPIAQNRHAVLMSIIQGEEISKFDELNDPDVHLNEIIREYKLYFSQAHIIHGDLSEFNILVDPDNNILIIDWPQWEDWNHPNARELVARDITNTCAFFKKLGVESNPDEIIKDILELNPKFRN
ncbi:MAG: RIO1 family regulatory kinase/ATPase domain-containing protein [Promethearchaeota archaeon]